MHYLSRSVQRLKSLIPRTYSVLSTHKDLNPTKLLPLVTQLNGGMLQRFSAVQLLIPLGGSFLGGSYALGR
jgi:hypothetical protein